MYIERVSDEELEHLAEDAGPTSVEAGIIRELRTCRARDRQVFVFRAGEFYFVGPVPDAKTEAAILQLAKDD